MTQEQWARVGAIIDALADDERRPGLDRTWRREGEESRPVWRFWYRDGGLRSFVGETPLEAAEKARVEYAGGDDEPE